MGIIVEKKKMYVGEAHCFFDSKTIWGYVTGFSSLSLSYGNQGHHLQKMNVYLTTNKTEAGLSITFNAEIKDKSNNSIERSESCADVVVIAYTGDTEPESVFFSQQTAIPDGGSADLEDLNNAKTIADCAILNGFDLDFETGDHRILDIQASVGVNVSNEKTRRVNGHALMNGDEGQNASKATVNAGVLAYMESGKKEFVISYCNMDKVTKEGGEYTNFTQGDFTDAVPLITSFTTGYKDYHDFGLLCVNLRTYPGQKDLIFGRVTLSDNSGSPQDDSKFSLSGIVVAYNSEK